MPKYKNYSKEDRNSDLKSVDAEKNSDGSLLHLNSEIFASRAKAATAFKPKKVARKKMPIAVDIIISILLKMLKEKSMRQKNIEQWIHYSIVLN
jgi:hypothetical protein